MIAAFTDESGNDGQSSVFAMATILLCHTASYYFANDWKSLLADYGITTFHATDFYGPRGEFRGWAKDRRALFQTKILNLLERWQIKNSVVLVENAGYRKAFVESGFNRTITQAPNKWRKPYLEAFINTVLDLREYADHQEGRYITPVFDDCQEFMAQARQEYDDKNRDGKLGKMHISTVQDHVQLQAADFIAFEFGVTAQHYFETGRIERGTPFEALTGQNFGAKIWNYSKLDYLRRRVEAIEKGIDPDTLIESSLLKRPQSAG